MKKLLSCILLFAFTSNVFAGTLENRETGEKINFDFQVERNTIVIDSNSLDYPNLRYQELTVKQLSSDEIKAKHVRGWVAIRAMCGDSEKGTIGVGNLCILVPLPLSAAIIDVVITAPTVAFINLARKIRAKNDNKKLDLAVRSNETVVTSNKRFHRIANFLNYMF